MYFFLQNLSYMILIQEWHLGQPVWALVESPIRVHLARLILKLVILVCGSSIQGAIRRDQGIPQKGGGNRRACPKAPNNLALALSLGFPALWTPVCSTAHLVHIVPPWLHQDGWTSAKMSFHFCFISMPFKLHVSPLESGNHWTYSVWKPVCKLHLLKSSI